jgi:MFS family permease
MDKTYSKAFWVLCVHMLLFFISFNLIIPESLNYLRSLGGEDYLWMILGLWTIAAAIARPFSGKIADNFGRKKTMLIGVTVSIIVSFLYPVFSSVTAFLVLRFLHGFSTGFQPTGATALVGDLIPPHKRGEAMGIFSMMISIGFGLGNYFSTFIFNAYKMDGIFIASGILGVIAFSLAMMIDEPKKPKQKITFDNAFPKLNEIIAPEVLHPTMIMFITATMAGLYYVIVPDFSEFLGIAGKGDFWLYFTATSLFMRFIAGKAADKYGFRLNIIVGLSVEIISGLVCAYSTTPTMFFTGAAIFGIGGGMMTPAVFAWTTNLANPVFKGRGLSTMFIALEIGIALGNFFGQSIFDYKKNYSHVFLFGVFLCVLGLIYLFFTKTNKREIVLSEID